MVLELHDAPRPPTLLAQLAVLRDGRQDDPIPIAVGERKLMAGSLAGEADNAVEVPMGGGGTGCRLRLRFDIIEP